MRLTFPVLYTFPELDVSLRTSSTSLLAEPLLAPETNSKNRARWLHLVFFFNMQSCFADAKDTTKTRSEGAPLPQGARAQRILFLSRQRADFELLGYPRAWETRFARENLQTNLPRKSVIVEVSWVTLGSPRSAPELSGCCWLLLVGPCSPQKLL